MARDRQLGLTATLADCSDDVRQSAKVDHALLEQLRQRVISIALGCPDGNGGQEDQGMILNH